MISPLALAVVLAAGSVAAAAVPEISLEMARCPFVSRSEVGRVAAIELDARVLERPTAGGHTTRVEVECDGTRVRLVVSDPLTGKQLMRSMDLTAREQSVADRMMALAVSELVLTSWLELTMKPAPDSALPPGTGAPTALAASSDLALRRAAQERAERRSAPPGTAGAGYALALGQATGPFRGTGRQWGGGIRLGWIANRRWLEREQVEGHPAVELDLGATWSDVDRSLGRIHVSTFSTSPRVFFRVRRDMAWVDVGLGVRLGLTRLVGAPSDPSTTHGATMAGTWAGPAGYLGSGLQWRRLVVAAGIEAGHVTRTVSGLIDEGTNVSIAGNWVTGLLAMGWGQ